MFPFPTFLCSQSAKRLYNNTQELVITPKLCSSHLNSEFFMGILLHTVGIPKEQLRRANPQVTPSLAFLAQLFQFFQCSSLTEQAQSTSINHDLIFQSLIPKVLVFLCPRIKQNYPSFGNPRNGINNSMIPFSLNYKTKFIIHLLIY